MAAARRHGSAKTLQAQSWRNHKARSMKACGGSAKLTAIRRLRIISGCSNGNMAAKTNHGGLKFLSYVLHGAYAQNGVAWCENDVCGGIGNPGNGGSGNG